MPIEELVDLHIDLRRALIAEMFEFLSTSPMSGAVTPMYHAACLACAISTQKKFDTLPSTALIRELRKNQPLLARIIPFLSSSQGTCGKCGHGQYRHKQGPCESLAFRCKQLVLRSWL